MTLLANRYVAAAIGGLKERQRRAISIEVGMQNSSLAVVLASAHFSSSLVALPPALSAVIMNIMGSTLGLVWQYRVQWQWSRTCSRHVPLHQGSSGNDHQSFASTPHGDVLVGDAQGTMGADISILCSSLHT
ncbi:hypothetical protein PR202_gb00411 [Eleusine coracana subsp. coracana]|uniref:Uncharacterized protein n=1 Tax=Eleusine coracana subsp. coracana TaxID=191504 RepID=A0AAV5DTL4_ELECO|nr:hypothetical protein PR202_gb00411 [Eleusine coracana subsp. coracana]